MIDKEGNGYFTAKRIACSFGVVVLAVVALIAIWKPDTFARIIGIIEILFNVSLSLAVVSLAAIFIVCCWFPAPRVRVKCADSKETEETDGHELTWPYPETYDKHCISEFQYVSDLHLMRFKKRLPAISPEKQYIVAKDYTVRFKLNGNQMEVTVPRGMLSDLASVPAGLRWIVGRVGPHLEAAIVHDYLYIAWQLIPPKGAKNMDEMQRFSDDLMFAAMKEAGMGCKAHAIYVAVRLFGKFAFRRKKNGWLIVPSCKLPNCDDG